MKKILILVVLAILLFACSAEKEKVSSDKTQIIFWHALGGPLGDALAELIADFNNSHPGIHVKAIRMGRYNALSQKLMASMQTDTRPNISQVYESWTANFVDGDVLVSIDEMIKNDPNYGKEELNDIYQAYIKSNTIDGEMWSFPFNKSVRVLYYNKDMFFEAGLDPNKPPVTWSDFREVCKKLTKDTDGDGKIDQHGTTFSISAWQFENLLLQAGGKLMNSDYTEPLFNKKPGVVALKHLYNLLEKDDTAYLSTGYEWQNDFLAGKVAMVEGSSVSLAYMQKTGINFFMGISAIPVYKNKKNIISGTNVAIFKSKDKEKEKAAWEFVKWFTNPAQTARWSEMTYYMPVRKSAFEEPILKERLDRNPEIASVYDQLKHATFEPPISEWYETRKYLQEQVIEKVFRNTLTPEEALDKAAKNLKKRLNENK